MLRNLFGAGFALFANKMYDGLGTPWATTFLGFVALAMGILPLVLYKYGARLRAASRFHVSLTTTDLKHVALSKRLDREKVEV